MRSEIDITPARLSMTINVDRWDGYPPLDRFEIAGRLRRPHADVLAVAIFIIMLRFTAKGLVFPDAISHELAAAFARAVPDRVLIPSPLVSHEREAHKGSELGVLVCAGHTHGEPLPRNLQSFSVVYDSLSGGGAPVGTALHSNIPLVMGHRDYFWLGELAVLTLAAAEYNLSDICVSVAPAHTLIPLSSLRYLYSIAGLRLHFGSGSVYPAGRPVSDGSVG